MASETFIPIQHLAVRLGLPVAWLVREAKAGRVPAIRAGRSLVADEEAVRASLLERAQEKTRAGTRAVQGTIHEHYTESTD